MQAIFGLFEMDQHHLLQAGFQLQWRPRVGVAPKQVLQKMVGVGVMQGAYLKKKLKK